MIVPSLQYRFSIPKSNSISNDTSIIGTMKYDKFQSLIVKVAATNKQEAQRATYRAPEHNMPPFWGIGQGGHFCLLIGQKKHELGRGRWDLASCQVSLNSIQRFQSRIRKCLTQSEGQGGHAVFPIGTKNTNLVEDVEILLPVKFRWILLSGFRGEVENVSANQRPGRPSCFSDRPEKHKLGRGRWDLASCQVSLNSVHQFQRRSRKCLSQSEAGAAILFFWSSRKTQTWKMTLRSCFLSSFELNSAVSEEKLKMSQPIRGRGSHIVFLIGPKNTNLVKDVEILLSVKFSWIPFSGFREKVNKSCHKTTTLAGRQPSLNNSQG